jgi:hypothetical protein
MDPDWITALAAALTAAFTGVLATGALRDWRREARPEIVLSGAAVDHDGVRLDVQVRNRSRETTRMTGVAVLAPYGAVLGGGRGAAASGPDGDLIGPGELLRRRLRVVVPDGWEGGEVALGIDLAPVSAAAPRRYAVRRTLDAGRGGGEPRPAAERLRARVLGGPPPERPSPAGGGTARP